MSAGVMLRAIQEYIRRQVPLNEEECGIRLDGRPPYWAGQRYASIVAESWNPGERPKAQEIFDESFAFRITVSWRTGYVPDDKLIGDWFLAPNDGMEWLMRRINKTMMRHRFNIMAYANELLVREHQQADVFVTPFRFTGTSLPQERMAEWWSADPDSDPNVFGYVMESTFAGAELVQDLRAIDSQRFAGDQLPETIGAPHFAKAAVP